MTQLVGFETNKCSASSCSCAHDFPKPPKCVGIRGIKAGVPAKLTTATHAAPDTKLVYYTWQLLLLAIQSPRQPRKLAEVTEVASTIIRDFSVAFTKSRDGVKRAFIHVISTGAPRFHSFRSLFPNRLPLGYLYRLKIAPYSHKASLAPSYMVHGWKTEWEKWMNRAHPVLSATNLRTGTITMRKLKVASLALLLAAGALFTTQIFAQSQSPAAATPEGIAAQDNLVVAEPASKVDLTVYGNFYAQIQESRTVKLKAGKNRVQLNGIAQRYRQDSLRIINTHGPSKLAYLGANYQPANLTTERLLALSVGKEVTARRWTTDGLQAVTGTLQSVNGNSLVLTANGKTELVSTNDVTLLSTPEGLSNTASLVVDVTVTTAGAYTLDFIYETEGITWSAKHTLVYDDTTAVVKSWETSVFLVNESGTNFKNATLRLLSGKVAGEESPGGMYQERAMGARIANAGDATVENVGDQKVFEIPGTVDLGAGQSRQIPLFTGNDVPVKQAYVVGSASSRYGYQTERKQNANIRLTVENCDKHHLGKPLPAGIVKVYQFNSAKKLQLVGSTQVSDKATDEIFDLHIGTSSDVKWELKLIKVEDVAVDQVAPPTTVPGTRPNRVVLQEDNGPKFEDRTYELVIYNYKTDRGVSAKIEMQVPLKQELDPFWSRPRADRADASVDVAKSDKTTVRLKVRIQVR